mmetsp:Transcript_44283/g.76522  ORF Transcript_44283/g.76522 Transcript_44283/m.76522 type:complete len:284 (+) Transcript_44283:628-1479(+)
MYSDMSILTRASSLSKSCAARALHSSVLPTPVGPRKTRLAMGFWGSLRPARDRCTASATARTASSCPITRSCSLSSRRRSFSPSAASIFVAGTPVQASTTAATPSAVTSSLSRAPAGCASSAASSAASSCCSLGSVWNLSSAALFSSYSRSAASTSFFTCSIFSLRLLRLSTRPRSASQRCVSSPCRTRSSAISLSSAASRRPDSRETSEASESFSISSWISRRSISSTSRGLLVISMLSRAAASSTRSMALSGRKRSEMYRWLSVAAATSAASRIRTPWCTS